MEDKKIKVKLTDVVAISKDPLVDLATPTITKEDGNIVSTQTQAGGVVGAQTKKTEISAVELEENLKPENIVKDVSIFGVVGTQKTETAKLEKTITKNEHYNYKSPEDVVGYDEVDLVVDVKPTTTTLPTQYINENGDFTIEKPEDPYTRYNDINLYVDVQPNLQDKIVNVGSNGSETITADEEDPDGVKYDGLKSVKINVDVKPVRESKTIDISSNGSTQIPAPEDEYKGWGEININTNVQPALQEKTTFKNGVVRPDSGYDGLSEVNVIVEPKLQSKNERVTNTREILLITPDAGYDGLSEVGIEADIQLNLQDRTVNITENGQTVIKKTSTLKDALGTVTVNVNVPSSGQSLIDYVSSNTLGTTFEYDGMLGNNQYPIFYGNTAIKTIRLNNSKYIPSSFAQGATALEEVYAPNVETVKAYSLATTNVLTKLQGAPITIERYAFSNAYRIEDIDFSRCTSIGSSAFYISGTTKRGGLININLPEVVTLDATAFSGQNNLISITMPKVRQLYSTVFSNCQSLVTVDMMGAYKDDIVKPALVTNCFTSNTFNTCSSLSTIVIRAGYFVPLTQAITFTSGSPLAAGTGSIYVPDNLVLTYQNATNWSKFSAIIKPLSTYNP